MRLTMGARLSLGAWLLVLVPHVRAGPTAAYPFNITCYQNDSINVLQNNNNSPEIFVVGGGLTCSDAMRHFTANSKDHLLNPSCKAGNWYILQVLDFDKIKATGVTLAVYNVSCHNGNASHVAITTATNVPYLEAVALPTLHIAILPTETTLNSLMTSSSLSSMYVGQEVLLTIYNDRSLGRASYMLVPTLCEAYPADNSSVRLTLMQHEGNRCTKQDDVIGQFTIEQMHDIDVAWASLYGFMFATYPDSDLIIECTVLVCSANPNGRQGRCQANNYSNCYNMTGYTKRRKRYVGVPPDVVNAEAGSTERTRIKLKYSLASSARVTSVERSLLLVAIMVILL